MQDAPAGRRIGTALLTLAPGPAGARAAPPLVGRSRVRTAPSASAQPPVRLEFRRLLARELHNLGSFRVSPCGTTFRRGRVRPAPGFCNVTEGSDPRRLSPSLARRANHRARSDQRLTK